MTKAQSDLLVFQIDNLIMIGDTIDAEKRVELLNRLKSDVEAMTRVPKRKIVEPVALEESSEPLHA